MTTNNFPAFAKAVRKRFDELAKDKLFVVDSDYDTLWLTYLEAFPEGANPVFRERTEHDCSCCRHFIRDIGNVVAIQNGALASVWDLNGLTEPYQTVADAMSAYVKSLAIRDVYLAPEANHGVEMNREIRDGATIQWHHFSVVTPKQFVDKDHIAKRGEKRTTLQVLLRGLEEIKPEAVAAVVDLISQNAIYRGAEFKKAVEAFQALQTRFLADNTRALLAWTMIDEPVARLRNTAIGTLLQDLSDGMFVEAAVRAYETKVAPQNYKRPTALITKGMVEAATKTIAELGLEEALERRHARLSDVSVNSVLFVDNAVQGEMKGGIKGLLMQEVKPVPFDPSKAEEIGIDTFVADVLPKVTAMKLYLENTALPNFVSMTAPVHPDVKSLFKWNNDFAWSYDGNVTDSIKDKVKRAGGRVENVALRISLAWFNYDDLDLHVMEPSGNHIYFGNKNDKLDVDMNVRATTREPVENIRWINMPRNGLYHVSVNQFTKREAIDVGFAIEIESPFGLTSLRFDKALPAKASEPVADIDIRDGQVTIVPGKRMVAGAIASEKWGVKTGDLIKVNSMVLSPNYWDDNAVGNKHWFFILDGVLNPEPARGIYNEFLHSRLEPHRKVFEVLGDKTKVPPVPDQLSGVGFSSTRNEKVTVQVTGPALNKAYTIVFGKGE